MTDLGDFGEFRGNDTAPEPSTDDDFERVDTDPVGVDTGIGALAVSSGLAISEVDGETRLKAYVTAANRTVVRLGTYLLVPYPDDGTEQSGEMLFARVAGLEYAQEYLADDATEIHARRAMRQDRFEERDYKLLANLEPLGVLYHDDGELRRRMTDRVPKPETVVRTATDKREIKTGLKIPDDGVFLGHLAVGGEKVRANTAPPTIDYRLSDDYRDGDPLVFRHTLIAGGTGAGKTHVAKNVLRQFLAEDRRYPVAAGENRSANPAVVLFDPQDEYAQMHDDNPAAATEDETRWEREHLAYGGHDDTIAFVPKVGSASYSASHHRAEQLAFTIPFSMVRRNPWLVASGGLNDNQYNGLTYLIQSFFSAGGDTYREFLEFLDTPTRREELDETGVVHEATYDAIRRRVRGFGRVFDQDARPITDLVHEFVRPGGLSVVPTYHLNDSRLSATVVLAVASLLIDEKLSNDPRHERIKDTPVVLGMDEAHNFLSSADSPQARRVITKFTEAAKQGRKERLGLFLITQDPQDIDDAVFKQVNTKLVLNLGDEDAITAVNIPQKLEKRVPYMEKGQMVVYSPDNSEPVELIGLSTCLTRHGRD